LYDLEKDRDEIVNVAADPNYQTIFAELSERLKQYQKQTRDPWFTKYTYE
jgi:N-sulfoglucosamine sulfohydrolase